MLRSWHAIRPLRREVVRTRLHVPNVENERIRFLLSHPEYRRISTAPSQPQPASTASTFAHTSQEKHYWDDTKLPPSPHIRPSDSRAPSLTSMSESNLPLPKRPKTVQEQDAEMLTKLEGVSGEGGSAGVEYEGGKAEGLKRAVKDNMFRVI